jgi:hypothetical protein
VGIRESLNKNPAITTGATIAVILAAVGFIVWEVMPPRPPRVPTQAYFTVDDGATWFPDDINKVAPFDHDGKDAVRCYVYKCSSTGTVFAAYLEKYTKSMQAKITQARSSTNAEPDSLDLDNGRLVKKPQSSDKWVRIESNNPKEEQEAQTIVDVKCKDDPNGSAVPQYP